MGGAPRNPAPRNHFLVCIVKLSGCHCTDAFDGNKQNIVECRPLLGALPLCLSNVDNSKQAWGFRNRTWANYDMAKAMRTDRPRAINFVIDNWVLSDWQLDTVSLTDAK